MLLEHHSFFLRLLPVNQCVRIFLHSILIKFIQFTILNHHRHLTLSEIYPFFILKFHNLAHRNAHSFTNPADIILPHFVVFFFDNAPYRTLWNPTIFCKTIYRYSIFRQVIHQFFSNCARNMSFPLPTFVL